MRACHVSNIFVRFDRSNSALASLGVLETQLGKLELGTDQHLIVNGSPYLSLRTHANGKCCLFVRLCILGFEIRSEGHNYWPSITGKQYSTL